MLHRGAPVWGGSPPPRDFVNGTPGPPTAESACVPRVVARGKQNTARIRKFDAFCPVRECHLGDVNF
jgi:hypothetical protein